MSYHQITLEGPTYRQHIELRKSATVIGRAAEADILLEDRQQPVSRRHAQLTIKQDSCYLQDLGSTNGTFLNNSKITPNQERLLTNGDLIRIGRFTLHYRFIEPLELGMLQETAVALPEEISQTLDGWRYLHHLPSLYHQDEHLQRFLALLEQTFAPVEWNIQNFDLFLHPGTAPDPFLPWLAAWFGITFDDSWHPDQRRTLLKEAHLLYKRLGTSFALKRVLAIYTEADPSTIYIKDDGDLPPHTFHVSLPSLTATVKKAAIHQIINAHKPAHTTYQLEIRDTDQAT